MEKGGERGGGWSADYREGVKERGERGRGKGRGSNIC